MARGRGRGHSLNSFSWSRYWTKLSYTEKIAYLKAIAHWPLNESSGLIANELIGNKLAALEFMLNGGFETLGAGGVDIWANWSEFASNGAISDEVVIIHNGLHAAKLTAGVAKDTRLLNTINLEYLMPLRGKLCTIKIWTRGDGVNGGRYRVYDSTNSAELISLRETGITGVVYTEISATFTIPTNCALVRVDLWCPNATGGIAYFDDVTLSVSDIPMSGSLSPTGITYGETGIGDGNTSLKFSGVNSWVVVGTLKTFDYYWNPNKGTAIAWGKVSNAGVWADVNGTHTKNKYLFHPKSRIIDTVYLAFGISGINANEICFLRRVAGAPLEILHVFTEAPTDWFCMGMIWDMTGATKRIACFIYVNGVFTEIYDQDPPTGDETWDKATYPVDDRNNVLMCGIPGAQSWQGWGAHVACWDKVLTDVEMERIMKI